MGQFLEILILAIVQGIGEFLPISSSGHLVVLNDVFTRLGLSELEDPLLVSIMLHLGTLASVVVVFRKRIVALLSEDIRVIPRILLATVPAVLIGYPLYKHCKGLLESPLLTGFCFLGTALLLLYTGRKQQTETGETLCKNMSWRTALLIGLFQTVAILPGFSRSGFTIAGGLLCKLRRDEAATFSFLLSIPVIGGAGTLEMMKLIYETKKNGGNPFEGLGLVLIGVVLSFFVGVIALIWLLKWLQKGKLHYFSYWLLLLGPIMIFLSLCFPIEKAKSESDVFPWGSASSSAVDPGNSKEKNGSRPGPPQPFAEPEELPAEIPDPGEDDSKSLSLKAQNQQLSDRLKAESPPSEGERPAAFWDSEVKDESERQEEEESGEIDLIEEEEEIPLTIKDVVGFEEEYLIALDENDPIWITKDRKRVVLLGRICLREGLLEFFACRRYSKEHESVVSLEIMPFLINAALLAVGAEPGRPAQFEPEFVPPQGQQIDIQLYWRDEKGGIQKATAQQFVAEVQYEYPDPDSGEEEKVEVKEMSVPFVFTGSFFREIEDEEGASYRVFMADATGELFGVSNFPASILDVPMRSSDSNEELLFQPYTERIPELGTVITLELIPLMQVEEEDKDSK